jgi:hypothetical protein
MRPCVARGSWGGYRVGVIGWYVAQCGSRARSCGQTIVRRLRQADTHDALLNPFIEKHADGLIVGHSPSSTGGSASPKPSVLAGDVVIAGPGPTAEEQEPQRPEFVSALQHALGLREEDLAVLRSTEPSSASPFVSSTLCAVSWVTARGRRGVCVGYGIEWMGWDGMVCECIETELEEGCGRWLVA